MTTGVLDPIDAAAAYAGGGGVTLDAAEYRETLAEQIGDAIAHALRCWPRSGRDRRDRRRVHAVADAQIERDAGGGMSILAARDPATGRQSSVRRAQTRR